MSDAPDSTVEAWKTIPEFPKYSVSNLGRIRRTAKPVRGDGIIKLRVNEYGYITTDIRGEGCDGHVSVARMVAKAFLEKDANPERGEINHKNGIKADNRPENLEWCTRGENMRHAYIHKLILPNYGEKSGSAKLTGEKVRAIRCLVALGHPPAVIGALFSVTSVTIRHIRNGKTWSSSV